MFIDKIYNIQNSNVYTNNTLSYTETHTRIQSVYVCGSFADVSLNVMVCV